MTTKEKILCTALELFSQRGYDGVSVRDIARAVGIRESSIYNHFKSKQAIFDGIVEFFYQQSEDYFRQSALPFDEGDDTSPCPLTRGTIRPSIRGSGSTACRS